MSTGEVKPSQPVRTGITWTARISSIVIAGVLALQQAGVVTPQNAATIKQVNDQLVPIADRIETAIVDKKLPDAAVIIDLANQVEKLVEQLQIKPKPEPTPIEPVPMPSPDQQRIADMEQQIKKLLDELAKKHEPPKPEPVSTDLKILDATGKPITGDIQSGQSVKVQAGSAGDWKYLVTSGDAKDVSVFVYPDHCILTLNGASVALSHASANSHAMIMVRCQDAPRPPPVGPEKPVVDDTKPNPVSTTAEWSSAVAKEAEVANASPAFSASEVVDGVLKFAVQDGMPKQIADSIRAAVPAIGASPARDLTPDEVEKIRGVK